MSNVIQSNLPVMERGRTSTSTRSTSTEQVMQNIQEQPPASQDGTQISDPHIEVDPEVCKRLRLVDIELPHASFQVILDLDTIECVKSLLKQKDSFWEICGWTAKDSKQDGVVHVSRKFDFCHVQHPVGLMVHNEYSVVPNNHHTAQKFGFTEDVKNA